ncbi:MAG: DUF1080 domain-containing protein [Planctomycetota bacterium]|nr:DUF1080 domain-containing protein [Planctomycetota bacterium]
MRWAMAAAMACVLAAPLGAAEPVKVNGIVVGDKTGDPFLGEYAGACGGAATEVKVWPEAGEYRGTVLLGARTSSEKRIQLAGKAEGPKLVMTGKSGDAECKATVADGKLALDLGGGKTGKLAQAERVSPTLGEKPPAGAIVLMPYGEGKPPSLEEWTNAEWKPMPDGSVLVGKGDNRSKRDFGDIRLHLEFMTPYTPDKGGQGRGNSGVYLQDRYEIQVLDSFGLESKDGDCGGIYKVGAPMVNACLPPGRWQTYDITFTAARFDANGKKTASARVTVIHNGAVIHEDREIPGPTGGARSKTEAAVAPLRLQDHGNPVRFRNIWVVELKAAEK